MHEIQNRAEYRNAAGHTFTTPDEAGCPVMRVEAWELEYDPELDVVEWAAFELHYNGVTHFDGADRAHSGDQWVASEVHEGYEYRGRSILIGFTDEQLIAVRQRVAEYRRAFA